jgi:phosphatidylserine/phosphatidylglycerophosphate/cardiolipin synthase-like enzyme
MRRYLILAAAIVATCGPARAEPVAPEIHFAPVENLEHIDVALLRSATKSIDLTAYVLTNWAIIAALQDARQRGVSIRIVLDPHEWQPYDRLTGLEVRVKRRGPLMNLKAYALDGAVLRTGSANFSASGEKQQDNDLIILWDPEATAKFEARFSEIWTAAEPMGGKE